MSETLAAGFVIFRRIVPEIQFLLLKASYGTKHWTPPKGHVDPGEDEYQTALRETEEEAGLKIENLIIEKDFKKILRYIVKGKPKKVTYWLAEVKPETEVKLSEEHTEFKWLSVEEVSNVAEHQNTHDLIRDCHVFIKSKEIQ